MHEQLWSLQEKVQKLEKNTGNLRRDLTDVDILTQHVHDTLYTQQQGRDGRKISPMKSGTLSSNGTWRRQTLTITTPPHMTDTCTADTRSQITIVHWKEDWEKQAFEHYVYNKWCNKRNAVRFWDTNNQTVYYGNEQHRISFVPQTSDMEREINLTIQAARHIVTKHEGSDLANS